MTECNHQTLSGAAVRATADMWLLNKMESICKQKLLLLQQAKTAKLRNVVNLYHFKCVTSLKLYTLYGKTVIFEDIHYILQYTAVQYLFYRQYTVRVPSLHIMFPVALSRGHMEEFMLSSTTQQINKPRPGQHLLPLRWTHPKSPYARVDRSLTHTHTAYQHSPSAGVSGCTLEEQTCDPELLLP